MGEPHSNFAFVKKIIEDMQTKNGIKTAMLLSCVQSLNHKPRNLVNPKMVFKDSSASIHQTGHPRTFIMRWNPEVSNHKLVDFEDSMEAFFDHDFCYDWSIKDYEAAKVGDQFFMLKVGKGNTGIVMQGTIASLPYKDEDWSGQGRDVRYVRMHPECMIHPDKTTSLLSTDALNIAIPSMSWNEGNSGVLLTREQTLKLEHEWLSYLNSFFKPLNLKNNGNVENI